MKLRYGCRSDQSKQNVRTRQQFVQVPSNRWLQSDSDSIWGNEARGHLLPWLQDCCLYGSTSGTRAHGTAGTHEYKNEDCYYHHVDHVSYKGVEVEGPMTI